MQMDMKASIVSAISSFVEVDAECDIDLSVSTDPSIGTVYSVRAHNAHIAITRTHAHARPELESD